MKKTTVYAPAKINFTLDVAGVENGFHKIQSFVATIDLCDKLIFKKRDDGKITLKDKRNLCRCTTEKNNAYKTAKAIVERYGLSGVDITINKKIPVGGGLGGSSVDIAGTIIGLKRLFEIKDDLTDMANELGSDCGYLISGGFAVISGRGEKVHPVEISKKMPILIIADTHGISAKTCYDEFDKEKIKNKPCTERAVEAFVNDNAEFFDIIKNDLYQAAVKFIPSLKEKISDIEKQGALKAVMTGSGSCVYGIFENEKKRNKAFKKLRNKYGNRLIKAQTLI